MRIYIDESGNFIVSGTPPTSFSVVLALIVPSTSEKELFDRFLRLRDDWPGGQKVEIKGSSLDESQASAVIDLLTRFDVIAEFVALDSATHTCAAIEDFKTAQAGALTANLTSNHHSRIVKQLQDFATGIRGLSNQLFVQAFLTIRLVLTTVQVATLYYVQRLPEELGDIAWIIDRKGRTITEMENIWSKLVLPMGQNHFGKTPLTELAGQDYSHFDRRYKVEVDGETKDHLEWIEKTYGTPEQPSASPPTDLTRLLTEQRNFADSRDSLGLQLADMLANILRRALNNRLQSSGWIDFGKLLVQKEKNKSPFLLIGNEPVPVQGHAAIVSRALTAKAKPLLKKSQC